MIVRLCKKSFFIFNVSLHFSRIFSVRDTVQSELESHTNFNSKENPSCFHINIAYVQMWRNHPGLCLFAVDMKMYRQITIWIIHSMCTTINIRLKADTHASVTACSRVNLRCLETSHFEPHTNTNGEILFRNKILYKANNCTYVKPF